MIFQINDKIKIEAEYYETRYSWGHKAWLYINNDEVAYQKRTYYNRTWESYKFQSVCQSVVEKALQEKSLTQEEAQYCQEWLKNYQEGSPFKTTAMVAMMGEIFGNTQEEKNDWKERMLKAGLPEGAISMPDDWDTLSEDEKEKRLNGAISILK